jgi:hypothetical protein
MRKEMAKKLVNVYDGVKRELNQTSETVNASLRSAQVRSCMHLSSEDNNSNHFGNAQDVWDMSISVNTKLKEIDSKMAALKVPLLEYDG